MTTDRIPVTVRTVPADLPEVDALLDAYLDEREATFPSAQGSYSRKRTPAEEFTPPRGVFVVAYDGDTPVGCGGLRRIADDGDDVRYEVKHVFVTPAGRGRGVATAVMDALEQAGAAFGATAVVLDTNDSLAAAGAMYRSRGYDRVEPFNDNPNATAWYRLGV
ncbi:MULTISPECIES: GNAT family N-acetyltransferase [unclassified Curtobacterium]|jgi:GNAT superfamily N-acetyltransferase|uniref:GNAT family N-acetyltransferase n=1 Tax=unclassified Curtobacterium TaxID=257496 RepID=UPI00188A8D53|nr:MULTISPECIES: GNAT family N-acetyltransferase [unclassified Curtobacterium]MBF4590114.1 GNAT family N-acetyltransferase [Curtobacterium sp. VKM Ac-1395]MCY1694750.1 GNAT family N-acetyltransferase [Curtobacterium sp. SL109]